MQLCQRKPRQSAIAITLYMTGNVLKTSAEYGKRQQCGKSDERTSRGEAVEAVGYVYCVLQPDSDEGYDCGEYDERGA